MIKKEFVDKDLLNVEILDLNENKLHDETKVETPLLEKEIEVIDDNNDILRRILVSRLTEEEKELIKIFGGKIC